MLIFVTAFCGGFLIKLPNLESIFSVVILLLNIWDFGDLNGEDLFALAELRRGLRLRLTRSFEMSRVSWKGY